MSTRKVYGRLIVKTPEGKTVHRNSSYSTRTDSSGPLRIFDSAGIWRKTYAAGRWYDLEPEYGPESN